MMCRNGERVTPASSKEVCKHSDFEAVFNVMNFKTHLPYGRKDKWSAQRKAISSLSKDATPKTIFRKELQKMKSMKKAFALVLALVLALSLSVSAFAIYDDYLAAADDMYIYYVDPGETATFYIVKGDYSFFTVGEITPLPTPSVLGNDFTVSTAISAEYVDYNEYMLMLEVTPSAAAEEGAVAVRVTVGTAHADFVVSVNDICSTSVYDISAAYFDGNGNKLTSITGMTVCANDHYGNTNYPSVNDSVYKTWVNQYGQQTTHLSNYVIQNDYGYSPYYVYSLSFSNNVTLTNTSDQGWQYRIYRNGVQLPASEAIKPDEILLHEYDEIIWAYGYLDSIDFDTLYAGAFN